MPRSQTSTVTSRIAGLADGPQQVISGTAVGAGDVTRGLSGDRKVWTAEELREAAESLTGAGVKALHSETVIGEVTDAGYVDDEGVVYEAEIEDEELAEAIANGRLTVSVEARHSNGGSVETDQGDAMAVTDIEFSDLAIVQHGAAPSASAEPGEAAALSPAEVRAALEDDDPASTEGDAEDIEISDAVEEGLENKVDEHNEEVDAGKEVTLGQLKKVFRRGAGAWFSSNKGATQQQWAYARVNEALKDIRNEKAINHGNDNDIFEDSVDYNPPDEEQSAALVDVNGTEVDLEAPARVKNAIEAAMDAKEEYDAIGDCGTGVGEEMGQAILNDELTPEIVTSGGDIAQYGPSTYLDGHGDEGPSTDAPPTDWGRMEWLGMESEDDAPRCGPVQLAMWGYYLEPFEEMKQAVEDARESEDMAEATEVPEAFRFSNPGEAVEQAKYLGVGEDRDLAGDDMIHTEEMDGETVFFPAPSREELLDRLREEGELAEPLVDRATDGDIRLPLPSENVQLLYPEESTAADAAEAMGLDGTHPHDFEGETWFMPGASHEAFVDAVSGMDAGMAGLAPVTKTARLNEYKAVGPIEFRGTRQGELDESAIPTDDFESHYFNDGENKSDSSFPLIDGEGYLRRGNLDAAWNLRGQGDLGMPRDSAERLMLNLGLVFGPPDSEANPLPQEAYNERDDVGTPYAEESAQAARLAGVTDDPETGEDTAERMSDKQAQLGSYLARAMSGKMEEMAYESEMGHAEMMEEMASHCEMSESHMRSIRRGDTACPSMDAIEAMSEVLDADMEMLLDAAKRDGCDYSAASYHDDADEEKMSDDPNENDRIAELEETVAELREENREVKREYAEALAGDDALLSTEELMEKFSVSELSEKYAEADAELASAEPTVRGGDAPTETADLSAGEQKRAEELEADLAEWQDRDSRLAEAEVDRIESELAELRGDD